MRRTTSTVRIPEKRKMEGLSYAYDEGGRELPVIDIEHRAFALDMGEDELARLAAKAAKDLGAMADRPSFARSLFLRLLLRGSVLAEAVGGARGGYASGMGIYRLKLGPGNLGGGWGRPIDRRIASSMPCLSARLRLRDISRLVAEALAPQLAGGPGKDLHMVNVAGGACPDSLNALMLLRRRFPGLLEGRTILIHVLDRDAEGPAFAARALSALSEPGAPLHGLDASLRHVPYDWSDSSVLRGLVREIGVKEAACVASSEGGLFEYGSDDDISANLLAFAEGAPAGAAWIGTISRAEGDARRINEASGAAIKMRTMAEFGALAAGALWRVARSVDCPLSSSFVLERIRGL